ncbi:hypothetical protein [Phormidium tenue]|uniref:Ribosomal protein L7/L12 C-terminal domain-containing protein n=1 Tax=Phormidium tenue NIES-30 TaxID=549789 RepID=A0A1U7J9T8_9CYAN|nr:hypothetical protein [Phormidium tenue]MBD2230754.1 hypothetical protein [Phormidium tenue FACHB-1052]OKH50189.1 hypothetical protein NIES30_05720 [Phormidium tenue NIES-30]
MVVVVFVGASLLAFGLSFWLTRWLQRPRPAGDQKAPAGLQGRSPQNGASSPSCQNPPATDLDRQVRDLLGQGRLIDAVKRVREVNGCSLSDAKAYVAERLP